MNKAESRWDGSEDELSGYDGRPISLLAIVSVVSGLLAGLAYILPALGFLFIVSFAAAVAAIFSNRREPKLLVWLAYVGVFVATVGTVWSLTTRTMYHNHMVALGEKFAEEWVQLLIKGQIHEAICLRMDYMDRPLEGVDLAEYFEQAVRPPDSSESIPPPLEMKEGFLDSKTVRSFLVSGSNTTIRLLPERTKFSEQQGIFDVEVFFEVEFLLEDGQGGFRRRAQTVSASARRIQYTSGAHWHISRIFNHSSPDMPKLGVAGDEGDSPEIPMDDDKQ
ncbi:MAG: hypothetical protein Q8M16_08850 [Pirellulaceae bacterium]|nr:hypothetical protein [Pirellulaceae bacterium]